MPESSGTRKPPRQMAAKACERCRRRKIKCDEFFPCGQCTRMRVACKIEDPAEKRREQQQLAMEDHIKRLEALLIATYTNPNNRIDMNIPPGLDQEGLLSNPALGIQISQGGQIRQGPTVKLEPPRLTLQTPISPDFGQPDSNDLLSAGEYSLGNPYWGESSVALSAPASASDYFPSDLPPWSTNATISGSGEITPAQVSQSTRLGERTRASSISTSETSNQEEHLTSPSSHERNRFSIDTHGSTLDIPHIEVTSWDTSRTRSNAGPSPALSPSSLMEIDMSTVYPQEIPDLSTGSWSGLSSPSILAPTYPFEENLLIVNQSLPAHSRRSSINSLTPDYECYNEPKRARAASDVFPVPQHFVFPDGTANELFTDASFQQPGVNHRPTQPDPDLIATSPVKDDIHTHTFLEVVCPLFPILMPQTISGPPPQNFTQTTMQTRLPPEMAQTQMLLLHAISTHILSRRNNKPITQSQALFKHGLNAHGRGKWNSLPGIQTGMLVVIYILMSGHQGPNIYLLNSNIVAACLDLGLHKGNCTPGSLESNLLLAAYVLDRTVALICDRPFLLKDEDLSLDVLASLKGQLKKRLERGTIRKFVEGGRLWDWWIRYENRVSRGDPGLDIGYKVGISNQALAGSQMDQGFGFS